MHGCLAWQKYGLEALPEVVEATDAYRTEQDTVGAFFAEYCTLDADVSVDGQVLYAAYRGWADGNGIRPLEQKPVGKAERTGTYRQTRREESKDVVWHWTALRVMRLSRLCNSPLISIERSIRKNQRTA